MELVLSFLVLISAITCFAYVILIASYCYAWLRMKPPVIHYDKPKTLVTIVIAARNEELNIERCLHSISNQSYPEEYFEVIIVDDASEDSTNFKIRTLCETNKKFRLITQDETSQKSGKKQAINSALKIAKGELIVTTDADCTMGKNWLGTIVSYYNQSKAKMIVSPVCYYEEKNVFQKMQSLEFMSLIFSSGASLFYNKAIMCNGANLAYSKKVFFEVNGFEGNYNQPSGDDVLLMYKIKDKYPKDIHFLKHTEAMVFTKPKATLKEFINQRKRWASKGFKALNLETKLVALIIFIFNAMLLILALLNIFYFQNRVFHLPFYKICLILLGIKCIIDFLLLFLSASFFRKTFLLIYFLPEQILYIVYIALIGILGFDGKYEWKGRKLK